MTRPLACCVVGRAQTAMPAEGAHPGPGHTAVGRVAVAVAPRCQPLHAARLGARWAMGDGPGAVLGRAHAPSEADRSRAGLPGARPGARGRVWRLGPAGGRAPAPPGARTGPPRTVGPGSAG